jgi:RHH-type proline utilization regulon transcriptional repressor/proline dehydrogenase/delta 1-pyrroline-5-carboxylate dehydrogenase
LRLYAETGGKNALYVSDMSDREQAISDVVRSAFGHSGQKCSALSQLILHEEVFNDRAFRETLADATSSLKVGSAWDLASVVTPLIVPPSELQRDALTQLADSERWLVEPRFDSDNPRLVGPGIKWGVKPRSLAHTTEFFCPLLSVLCASNLEDALEIANATHYGLTAGIHSLDEREQAMFVSRMQAGNLYVNRPITGAIVRRQPFGGWKDSSFGPGAKAGGPNYVGQFVTADASDVVHVASSRPEALAATHKPRAALEALGKHLTEPELHRLAAFAMGCSEAYSAHFERADDVSLVNGEENVLLYRPARAVAVWVTAGVTALDVAMVALAAATCATTLRWFANESAVAEGLISDLGMTPIAAREVEESSLIEYLSTDVPERLRVLGKCSDSVVAVANQRNIAVVDGRASLLPRLELAVYLREQAVSTRYHRYGHLGMRQLETRG